MHAFCSLSSVVAIFLLGVNAAARSVTAGDDNGLRVKTANGELEGVAEANGVRAFRGVPFAQPPVGELRWRAPQPAKDWEGVRKSDHFGPRPIQLRLFGDMVFRSPEVSEDCLYLNVWTPPTTTAGAAGGRGLPVLVYFFGGGFVAGDSSENRYDGAAMAARGIVAVTVNYRLGVFGFLAHPELTAESPDHASGNYGLLDQSEALRWVKKNIAAFGGDPDRITIGGESAGSFSVSAQMASPLSRDLIAGAIGESGSLLGSFSAVPLAEAEKTGARFATEVGAKSLADLRKMSADDLLKAKTGVNRFPVAVDGHFFVEAPLKTFAESRQAHVPLLVGWNSEESGPGGVLGRDKPTRENYEKAIQRLYGPRAADALKAYAVASDADVTQAATDLASDRFIGFSTWKWADLQAKTGGKPVYRYLYARPRPGAHGGAVHSAEIEYALGNLSTNKVFAWTPDDYKVSQTMQAYFANFIKTGDPNGPDLPKWPPVNGNEGVQVMRIDVESKAAPEAHRERYLFLDGQNSERGAK